MKKEIDNPSGIVGGILVLVFLNVIACGTAVGDPSWTITQLTNNSTDDVLPAISGTNVVWYGWDGSNWAVYSNFAGKLANTNITNLSFIGSNPAISGTNVVWVGYDGHNYSEIYSNFAGQLTNYDDDAGPGYGAWFPDISGTNVVWEGISPGAGWQIVSNFAGQISAGPGLQHGAVPAISGTNVVWQGDGGIHSNFAGQISNGNDSAPDISGTNVVWQRYEGPSSGGVAQYNLYSNFGGLLPKAGWWDCDPAISGTNVTWVGGAGVPFGYSIWSNFGGEVVNWAATLGASVRSPDISGFNVVFEGYDGQDSEIYMATYGEAQAVPLPGAALLGILGLAAAGSKLRRYA